MSDAQRIGAQARRELELTEGLFERMKAQAAADWMACRDAGTREELWRSVQVVDAVRGKLVELIAAGEIEAHAEQFRDD